MRFRVSLCTRRGSGPSPPPRSGNAIGWLIVVAMWLCPCAARAQLTESVLATGQYVYDSNVFDLQRGFATGPNDYSLADHYYEYGAGLNLNEQISQQNLFLKGTDSHYDYAHFSQLTHNEYNLDGGWLWKIAQVLNGSLEVTRTHTMVPFTEIISVALSLETDQREQASAALRITPRWGIDTNAYTETVDEPLPTLGAPNLKYSDAGGGATLRYQGTAAWQGNLNVAYQHGSFSGASAAGALGSFGPAYTQWTGTLGTSYAPSGPGGLSTFDFAIGRTKRSSPFGLQNFSGTTGHLDYTRKLTGKTTVSLAVQRDISTFIANAGATLSDSASLSATWQATYKTGFNLGYNYVYVDLPFQGVNDTDRLDHLQFASFAINYQALPWMAVRPFADYQTRTSNLFGANFNASLFGVSVLLQWPKVSGPAPQPSMPAGMAY